MTTTQPVHSARDGAEPDAVGVDITEIRAFRFNAAKRRVVRAIFAGMPVRFVWAMGWRWRDYPQSRERAAAALTTARRRPRAGWLTALRLALLRLEYNATRQSFERHSNRAAVTWNGLVSTRNIFMMAARDAGCATLFFERGPFPHTITADPVGVNFANGVPRDPARFRAWAAAHPDDLGAWRPLADRLVGRAPKASRAVATATGLAALSEPFLFVPLQKLGDTQLRIYGGVCRDLETTLQLLTEAAEALPPGWHIRLKEHPTDQPRLGTRAAALARHRLYLDNDTETFAQVRAARAVLTVNSSVGLEAMLLEKPVIVMGHAFWALPGLATHAPDAAALAALFRAPDQVGFDAVLRDAFLSFLVASYYPIIGRGEDGRPQVDAATRSRVLRRLATGQVMA